MTTRDPRPVSKARPETTHQMAEALRPGEPSVPILGAVGSRQRALEAKCVLAVIDQLTIGTVLLRDRGAGRAAQAVLTGPLHDLCHMKDGGQHLFSNKTRLQL